MPFQYDQSGQLGNSDMPGYGRNVLGGMSMAEMLSARFRAEQANEQAGLAAQQLQLAHAAMTNRGQTPTQGNVLGSHNPTIGQSMVESRFQQRETDRQQQQEQTQKAVQDKTQQATNDLYNQTQVKWNVAHEFAGAGLDPETQGVLRDMIADPKATEQQMRDVVTKARATKVTNANKEKQKIEKAHPFVGMEQPPSQFNKPDALGGIKIKNQANFDAYRDYAAQQQIVNQNQPGAGRGGQQRPPTGSVQTGGQQNQPASNVRPGPGQAKGRINGHTVIVDKATGSILQTLD